jgi:hypothetical protein
LLESASLYQRGLKQTTEDQLLQYTCHCIIKLNFCLLFTSNKTIMTTLLARFLLIAFVANASSQRCTLCPNGEKPRNGDLVVVKDQRGLVTCNDEAREIAKSPPEFCASPFNNALQVVCGCPGVKPGPCPGICETGSVLTKPNKVTMLSGFTCLVVDQIFREPIGANCDSGIGYNGIEADCPCKVKMAHSPINMGGMGMSGGRQLRSGDFEENFPPRAARGSVM